jgi:hypothetical protein
MNRSFAQDLADLCGAIPSAHFLILSKRQQNRPPRLKSFPNQRLHRFKNRNQRPLHIHRPPAPHRILRNRPGERWVSPTRLILRRHHIQMSQNQHRLKINLAPFPGEQQAVLTNDLALERVIKTRIRLAQELVQSIESGCVDRAVCGAR